MTNHIDDVVESVDTRKARDRFFLCISYINENIVYEFVKAESSDEAELTFEKTHGECPDFVDSGNGNGWRPVGGLGKTETERLSITVDGRDVNKRTSTCFEAEYRGWLVSASGLRACEVKGQKFNDDELFKLEFLERLPGNTERKPRFSSTDVVKKSYLTNIRQL
jgi:hypothetical protein